MTTLFDFIKQQSELKIGPLLAIWLNHSIHTTLGQRCRIEKDMMVRIENDWFVDVDADNSLWATHLILECRGTVYSTNMSVLLEDLVSGEEIIINL